jgi:hypothetical protein
MRRREQLQQTEDVTEQRRREDEAPRLREVVSQLRTLRLRFQDVRDEGRHIALPYIKPVIVQTAPAHFEIHCMEPRCDGRHDLTRSVLNALRASQRQFSGTVHCHGMVGDLACDRVLAYSGEAAYLA